MPSLITQRLFFSGTKQTLRGEGVELTRQLSIGNNWTTIRVGILCAINGAYPSTQNLSVPWALGLCSNNSGFSQKYTDHFVGWFSGAVPLLTYSANSGNPYYTVNGFGVRRVGFTNATASAGSTNINVANTEGTVAKKAIVIVDITKGFTSTAYSTATTAFANPVDITVKDFLESFQTPLTPTVLGIAMTATTSQTLTGTEGAGDLNTFSLYWGNTVVPFEVYAMAAYRML
jgi:hypothetical protein